jgi:hypothetical protein
MLVVAGKNVVPVIKMRADVIYARDMREAEAMAFAIILVSISRTIAPQLPLQARRRDQVWRRYFTSRKFRRRHKLDPMLSITRAARTVGKHGRLEYSLSYDPGGAGWSTD